jgi:hypothetical protein
LGSGAPEEKAKRPLSDMLTGGLAGEAMEGYRRCLKQRSLLAQKCDSFETPYLVLNNIQAPVSERGEVPKAVAVNQKRTWFNWFFGSWFAKYHRKQVAEDVQTLFIDEVYEDEDTLKDEGLSSLPSLLTDETTTFRKQITRRIKGSNARIRHRAARRVAARIRILRVMTEDLKFTSSVKTRSPADVAYLEHQARTLIERWCKDQKEGHLVVAKSRNFFLEGLCSLYWVRTEDDTLWEDVREAAASHVAGFD